MRVFSTKYVRIVLKQTSKAALLLTENRTITLSSKRLSSRTATILLNSEARWMNAESEAKKITRKAATSVRRTPQCVTPSIR